jgi:hypothetical protein
MNYLVLTSCLLCSWAMLRMMGSERSRMLTDLEARLRAERALASAREAKKAAQNSDAAASTAASPTPAAKPPPVDKAKH